MDAHFSKRVAIIGLGLLGASLALALKATGSWHVSAWTRNRSVRDTFLAKGFIDSTSEKLEDVLGSADIVILCMPVPQIGEFCAAHAASFKKGALVSDVGSVKGVIMDAACPALEKAGCRFVGGHPMAGSEKSGPEAASASLFKGAVVFLTPSGTLDDPESIETLRKLWSATGAITHCIEASTHDLLIAKTSHLPHALSWSLAQTALDVEPEQRKTAQLACASSFRDMTRVAASSPELWTGIFDANRDALLEAIDEFKGRLELLRFAVEKGDLDSLAAFMELGRSLRIEWEASKPKS